MTELQQSNAAGYSEAQYDEIESCLNRLSDDDKAELADDLGVDYSFKTVTSDILSAWQCNEISFHDICDTGRNSDFEAMELECATGGVHF